MDEAVEEGQDRAGVDGQVGGQEGGGGHQGGGVVLDEEDHGPGNVPNAQEVDGNVDPLVVVRGVEDELVSQVQHANLAWFCHFCKFLPT